MKYGGESESASELSARLRESLGTSQASREVPSGSRPLSAAAPSFSSSLPATSQGPWGPPAATAEPPAGPLGFNGAVTGSAAAYLRSPGDCRAEAQLLAYCRYAAPSFTSSITRCPSALSWVGHELQLAGALGRRTHVQHAPACAMGS